MNTNGVSRIVLALDGMSLENAVPLVSSVGQSVFMVKIHELWDQKGPGIVRTLKSAGAQRVWVDLKLHDIPNTVKLRTEAVLAAGADLVTVHVSGGFEMMIAARETGIRVAGITVLTSLDEENAHLIFGSPVKAKVLQLARDAKMAGLWGVVCSPKEVGILAKRPELAGLKFIVPGIRPARKESADQKRVDTPAAAIAAGADFLVIGRAITEAPDPIAAITVIGDEIGQVAREEDDKLDQLAVDLFNCGAILTKKQSPNGKGFRIKLHETNPEAPLSPIYIDLRVLRSYSHVLARVARCLADTLEQLDFDLIADVPTAATPIVAIISLLTGKPMITPRGEKSHGSGSVIDGRFEEGQRVVVIDDLITKAQSKLDAISSLQSQGLVVRDVVVLVDRQQGGVQDLTDQGYRVHWLFRLHDLLRVYRTKNLITQAESDEVVNYLER